MSRRAVVLGASIAGLLAARALTEAYPEVVIVERDELSDEIGSEARKGVPHGRQGHGLLAGGLQAMEEMLPGVADDLVARGAHDGDVLENLRLCATGGPMRQVPVGLRGLAMTRPLLESYLRSRVRSLPAVQIKDGTDIIGPTTSAAGRAELRVNGVRVQRAGEPEEHITANLVVDATGRGSRTPLWLEEMGYPKPVEEKLRVDLTYNTRFYELTRPDINNDLAIIVLPSPERPRGGFLLAQENGRGIVTLFGILGDQAPSDEAGYLEFARSLPQPDLYNAIKDLKPVTEPAIFKYPASTRHHYEDLKRFPAGLLVIGDAICSFNPAYGQGMSISAKEAAVLRQMLADGGEFDARKYFRTIAPMVEFTWQMMSGGDLSLPGVEGERTMMVRMVNRYLLRLQTAATRDAALSIAFSKVMNLLETPPTLMRPDRALRVLLRGRPTRA